MEKLNPLKKISQKSGQGIAEYFIVFSVVVVAILSTDFIGRMRANFEAYFNKATASMPLSYSNNADTHNGKGKTR